MHLFYVDDRRKKEYKVTEKWLAIEKIVEDVKIVHM